MKKTTITDGLKLLDRQLQYLRSLEQEGDEDAIERQRAYYAGLKQGLEWSISEALTGSKYIGFDDNDRHYIGRF